jgi:hypothetical protein
MPTKMSDNGQEAIDATFPERRSVIQQHFQNRAERAVETLSSMLAPKKADAAYSSLASDNPEISEEQLQKVREAVGALTKDSSKKAATALRVATRMMQTVK